MRVLIACEFSGVVRDAFIKRGHDAISCDLLMTVASGPHIWGDVLKVLNDGWDMMIAHPPCTYLCSSGLHRNKNNPVRQKKTKQALEFVQKLLDAPIPKIIVENPVGCISTQIRIPEQIIQPYEFGEDASKKTCLWLKGVKPLNYTYRFPGRWVRWNGRLVERWSNQTNSGQNKLPPSKGRWAARSVTYTGIALAMASQWCGCKQGASQRATARYPLFERLAS